MNKRYVLLGILLLALALGILAMLFFESRSLFAQRETQVKSVESLLEIKGLDVSRQPAVMQPFFTKKADVLTVNDGQVFVWAYNNPSSVINAAADISADGSVIGPSVIDWVSDPHFYKNNEMIILYVGNDTEVLQTLKEEFGEQFAGR